MAVGGQLLSLCLSLFLCGAFSHGAADGGRSSHWLRPQAPHGVRGSNEDYIVDGATYQGYLAVPLQLPKLPRAVLIAHQFMGLGEYEMARADELASMGYAAFALDVYGKGIRCNTTDCGGKQMSKALSNITKLRGLISASTQQLLGFAPKGAKLVAMGYCFGGSMVLELARHPGKGASAGVTFAGVSSIHGTLHAYSDEAAKPGEILSNVQVHHAEFDFQGDAGLETFKSELKVGTNGTVAQWEALYYSKVMHGWTEPGTPVYSARAAVQAHKSTFEFFQTSIGLEDPSRDAFPQTPFCQEPEAKDPFHV